MLTPIFFYPSFDSTAERCERVTPGQDPRDFERFGEKNEIVVLKNLPFNTTEKELQQAIVGSPCPSSTPLSAITVTI